MVNNAGISLESGRPQLKTHETPEDWWDVTMAVNTKSVFLGCKYAAAQMVKQPANAASDRAWIINISSISGLIKTAQHHFAYNASKGAAVHLTRMLAAEIVSSGLKIRVNGIAPGVFPSEMTTEGSDENQKSSIPREKYAEKVPARRPGKDEDMASAVLFFATNQYLSGQTLAVDGGYTLAAGM